MKEKYTGIDTFSVENIPLYIEAAKNGCVFAFDTETTGLHNHDDIVELGCVEHEQGRMTFEYSVYLKNTVPINGTEASQVNGLTDEFLAEKGEDPKQALADFMGIIQGKIEKHGRIVLAAHNLPFDLRMLHHALIKNGLPPIPTDGVVGCDLYHII